MACCVARAPCGSVSPIVKASLCVLFANCSVSRAICGLHPARRWGWLWRWPCWCGGLQCVARPACWKWHGPRRHAGGVFPSMPSPWAMSSSAVVRRRWNCYVPTSASTSGSTNAGGRSSSSPIRQPACGSGFGVEIRIGSTVLRFRPASAARRPVADLTLCGRRAGPDLGCERWPSPTRCRRTPCSRCLALTEAGRRNYLSIDFATPVPPPEFRDIVIDLSGALASPQSPAVPLIRVVPMRWKEGYT